MRVVIFIELQEVIGWCFADEVNFLILSPIQFPWAVIGLRRHPARR